jgi:hypothetical protein
LSYRARCIGRRNLRALRRRLALLGGSASSWAQARRKLGGEHPTLPAGVNLTVTFGPHRITWKATQAPDVPITAADLGKDYDAGRLDGTPLGEALRARHGGFR